MWIYEQKTGKLYQKKGKAILVGTGYSGYGPGKNKPDQEAQKGIGPIPRGLYYITRPAYDSPTHGPLVLSLTPDPDNNMHGRTAFLIHGDSVSQPGLASHGCICLPRYVRERVANSTDAVLEVVNEYDEEEGPGPEAPPNKVA